MLLSLSAKWVPKLRASKLFISSVTQWYIDTKWVVICRKDENEDLHSWCTRRHAYFENKAETA